MDVLGYFVDHGISGVNSVLMAVVYFLIRNRISDLQMKLDSVYEWHLIQKGIERERINHRNEEEE